MSFSLKLSRRELVYAGFALCVSGFYKPRFASNKTFCDENKLTEAFIKALEQYLSKFNEAPDALQLHNIKYACTQINLKVPGKWKLQHPFAWYRYSRLIR